MPKSTDESEDENADVYFEPIISLPLVNVKTLEENENCVFKSRAKLFRFDIKSVGGSEWKERGTGELKILQDPETLHCRVLMRRDKTLKMCANHYISTCMELKLCIGDDRAFVWTAPNDFIDGQPKSEILAVRFKTVETAQEFQHVFNEQKSKYEQSTSSAEVGNPKKENTSIENIIDAKDVQQKSMDQFVKSGVSEDLTKSLSTMKIESKPEEDLAA